MGCLLQFREGGASGGAGLSFFGRGGGLVRGGRGARRLLGGRVLARPLILGAVRLRSSVEVRVPASALELERGLADQLLDLLCLALGAGADRLVGHLLPLFELVAAGGTGVFIDGHAELRSL